MGGRAINTRVRQLVQDRSKKIRDHLERISLGAKGEGVSERLKGERWALLNPKNGRAYPNKSRGCAKFPQVPKLSCKVIPMKLNILIVYRYSQSQCLGNIELKSLPRMDVINGFGTEIHLFPTLSALETFITVMRRAAPPFQCFTWWEISVISF